MHNIKGCCHKHHFLAQPILGNVYFRKHFPCRCVSHWKSSIWFLANSKSYRNWPSRRRATTISVATCSSFLLVLFPLWCWQKSILIRNVKCDWNKNQDWAGALASRKIPLKIKIKNGFNSEILWTSKKDFCVFVKFKWTLLWGPISLLYQSSLSYLDHFFTNATKQHQLSTVGNNRCLILRTLLRLV